MRKKLAELLFKFARWLNPSIVLENTQEARPIGLCIHISKKDVRDFRKNHPEIKSHRDGMKLLIEEAKWRVAGAIGRGLMDKKVINFDVNKTLYVADVSGVAYVYGGEYKGQANTESAE